MVDAQDKVLAYGNWLGILQGTLTEQVSKGGKSFTRGLNADRVYQGPNGGEVTPEFARRLQDLVSTRH